MRAVATILMMLVGAFAQTDARLKFEIASIKPAAPDAQGMLIRPGPGGGISITNMSLKQMMAVAFSVQPFQISGGPLWLDSVRYDVIAKSEAKPKQDEIPSMLQSLLEERFQLLIHRETKELPVYAIVMARKDGKLGPGLTQSKECEPPDLALPPGLNRRSCGFRFMSGSNFEAVSIPVADIIPVLSRHLERPVIDKTGLDGKFDIRVNWGSGAGSARGARGRGADLPAGDTVETSIFTAFQEQLGLKLEAQKGPVEIIVIDRAEKPSEN